MMRRRIVQTLALGLAIVASAPDPAQAQATESEAPTITLRTSIKAGGLVFRRPDAPALFPDRAGAESLWRIRFEPEVSTGTRAAFALAYEQRFRYTSQRIGITTVGILPSDNAAPYRIRQLDWGIAESANGSWRHEIDRANARVHAGRADITVGRQAVGWGRGVMFGAVDLFAPFSPLEADREWRRGIDAARADVKLSDRSSVDVVTALDTTWNRSLAAARVRGYAGHVDLEAMAGRRARDVFAGFTTSAAVGDAELHGELAAFNVPTPLPLSSARVIWKGVAGGSYRLPIGSGVLVYAEYHYSGFGARSPADIGRLLSDAAFAERYIRGDTQILSRHAVGVLGSYEASTELALSGQWVHNPVDRSGVIAPGLTVTLSDRLSIFGASYLPYGVSPRGTSLRSEYGTAPVSAFLQLRVYL
jgi:hypothetical protein